MHTLTAMVTVNLVMFVCVHAFQEPHSGFFIPLMARWIVLCFVIICENHVPPISRKMKKINATFWLLSNVAFNLAQKEGFEPSRRY